MAPYIDYTTGILNEKVLLGEIENIYFTQGGDFGANMNKWIDKEVETEGQSFADLQIKIMDSLNDAASAGGEAGAGGVDIMNTCIKSETKYAFNVKTLENIKARLQYYKSYILKSEGVYDQTLHTNSKSLLQMKAMYTSQYTILVDTWINRIRVLYYLILIIYIGLLVKNRKYRSKPQMAIALVLGAYPLIIDTIMLQLLSIMDEIFKYTPANSYRNLYNQNINKLEKNDVYIHYTQLPS